MTAHVLARADALGFATSVSRDPERVAGTVAVDVPEAQFVARALKSRDFLIDYRVGAGIRVSPHFYNTLEELDRLLDEIARIVRTRDYDTSVPFTSVVPRRGGDPAPTPASCASRGSPGSSRRGTRPCSRSGGRSAPASSWAAGSPSAPPVRACSSPICSWGE